MRRELAYVACESSRIDVFLHYIAIKDASEATQGYHAIAKTVYAVASRKGRKNSQKTINGKKKKDQSRTGAKFGDEIRRINNLAVLVRIEEKKTQQTTNQKWQKQQSSKPPLSNIAMFFSENENANRIKEEGKSPRKKGEVANTVFAIVQQKTRIYKEARSTEQEHG